MGTGKMTSLDALVDAIIDVFCSEQKVSEKIYKPEKHDCVNYFMNVDKARHNLGYSPSFADAHQLFEDYERKRWRPIVLVISFRSDMAHRPHTARREVGMFSRNHSSNFNLHALFLMKKNSDRILLISRQHCVKSGVEMLTWAILLKRIPFLGFWKSLETVDAMRK